MRRKYCFCILCIALFLFSGCAGAHHAEKGNVSDSGAFIEWEQEPVGH